MTFEPIVIVAVVIILLAIVLPIYLAKRETKKKGLETALAVSKSNHPSAPKKPEVKDPEPSARVKPDLVVSPEEVNAFHERHTAIRKRNDEAEKVKQIKFPETPKPQQKFGVVDPYEYENRRRYESDVYPSYAMLAAMTAADQYNFAEGGNEKFVGGEYVEEFKQDTPQEAPVVAEEPAPVEVVESTPSQVESFSYTPEPSYSEPVPSSHGESYSSFSYTPDTSSSSSYSSSSDSSSSYSSSSYDSGSSSSYSSDSGSSSFSFD